MGGMMGKGGPMGAGAMRPMMPQQMGQAQTGQGLAAQLAAAPPGMQKQMLGERLFPLVSRQQPEMAGKVTGMMLEMDDSELIMILESPEQLKFKVDEALRVLESQNR